MKKIFLMVVFASAAYSADASKIFTGVVTDTMCGSKPHSGMMKDKTDVECVRICTRGANQYALFDGTAVMKLSDQKTPEKYAGQRVRVTGTYNEKSKTIRVISIVPESLD